MFNHFTEVTTQERLHRMYKLTKFLSYLITLKRKYENEDFEDQIHELKLTLASSTKSLEQVIEKLNKEITELKE